MILRIIDFQLLTLHYKNYREGANKIAEFKNEFLLKLEPLKQEINEIIKFTETGLIVDRSTQKQKSEKFQMLQDEVLRMDSEFKHDFKKMSDSLNEKVYDELSIIIDEWSIANNIDVTIGKMEVVYNKSEFDATKDIINVLIERELYVD